MAHRLASCHSDTCIPRLSHEEIDRVVVRPSGRAVLLTSVEQDVRHAQSGWRRDIAKPSSCARAAFASVPCGKRIECGTALS
eukprot:316225-Amphidinium_carterae.1